jgi:hypothetical protein
MKTMASAKGGIGGRNPGRDRKAVTGRDAHGEGLI